MPAALDAASAIDSASRALLLATPCAELAFSGERERIARLASEAMAIARHLGDPLLLLRVTPPHSHVVLTQSDEQGQ